MRTWLPLLTLAAACNPTTDAPPPPAPTAPAPAVAPPPAVAPDPAPTAETPCLVGRWEAADFVAMLRRRMRREMQEARLTRASGTITLELSPPDAQGAGTMVATADELVHRVSVQSQGFRATGTHTMNGGSTMPYTLPALGVMEVGEPTEGELTARVSVRTNIGVNLNRGAADKVELDGTYRYTCEGDELTVRAIRANGTESQPMTFRRMAAE